MRKSMAAGNQSDRRTATQTGDAMQHNHDLFNTLDALIQTLLAKSACPHVWRLLVRAGIEIFEALLT